MTFKRFEEIEAWKMARELCKLVRSYTERPGFSKDWELRRQIRESSGSVMDCIAEGFERGNTNEFKYFLGVAKGSCGEVRSQGYRALDYGYLSEAERSEMDQLAKRTSATIQGLIDYLNITTFKGQRHHVAASKNDHFFPPHPPNQQPSNQQPSNQ
ncbi:MAG: four helix bundle protein [Saprospirales bacterium]|nr:four helix bundle protein [Saprospirales bacterium]